MDHGSARDGSRTECGGGMSSGTTERERLSWNQSSSIRYWKNEESLDGGVQGERLCTQQMDRLEQ
jgi:hypothetical protein